MKVTLNKTFWDHAKVYQSKPVVATRYKPGMENGWVVIYAYERADGFKFFDDYEEAKRYCEDKPTHKLITENGLVEVECFYDDPCAVIYTKKLNQDGCSENTKEFEDDEKADYDVCFVGEDMYIIQDDDGNIRAWDSMCCESFFGKHGVYQREGGEYIKTDIVDVRVAIISSR